MGVPEEKMTSIFYWPANVFEDNMPIPLLKLQNFGPEDFDVPFNFLLDQWLAFGLSLLYIGLFLGLSYRSFMKNDI